MLAAPHGSASFPAPPCDPSAVRFVLLGFVVEAEGRVGDARSTSSCSGWRDLGGPSGMPQLAPQLAAGFELRGSASIRTVGFPSKSNRYMHVEASSSCSADAFVAA